MKLRIYLRERTNPLTFSHIDNISKKIIDDEVCFYIEHNTITSDNEKKPLHDLIISSEIERVEVCSDSYNEDDLRNLFCIISEIGCIYTYDINPEDE